VTGVQTCALPIFQNNSSPRYKGIASECRFIEKPSIKLGQKGFDDFVYKILMTDYNEVFLGKL
jgi:hypothetical protein